MTTTAAPLQNIAAKSQPLSNSTHAGLVLQRKCACGGSTSSLTGECAECKSKKHLQTKLTIGASNEPPEQEADRVADQVLAAPGNSAVSGALPHIQRFTGQTTGQVDTAPASVDRVLASPGSPLGPALRQDMEQRFGHDFSRVRVHSGSAAEQSARDVNANAYTVGHNIVFGAGRFAPGTNEGQRLIAHELTHVVQQSNADGSSLDQSNEKRGRSPISIHAPVANVLYAQPTHRAKKESNWKPEVKANTRSAYVKVGKTVSLKFHVSNERTAPKGTTFDWRGMRLEQSAAITMVGFSDHVGAHASLVVKGQTAGISEVGTTVYFKTPGAQEDHKYTPLVRVEVGSAIKAAEAELGQIEKLRGQGKKVDPSRESAAQQEAVAAGQQTLGKASRAGGNEIDQIITRVREGISTIENARYNGYQDALLHLNLTQLDAKEQAGNVRSFALSLAGNLIWALSGLIAISPIGPGGLAIFTALQAARATKLATAVGVGGAMLAQFANGLPSGGSGGGNVSSPLILLQQKLNQFNSDLFNKMRSDLYLTLLAALDNSPPGRDVDAQQYAGQLETGIRHVLFGGYLENGGATGNQINADVIQIDARDQLLRRLIVTSGKISGAALVSTKLDERGLGKLVGPAVNLVGGVKALELGDYELVVEQLQRMARELGLEGLPNVDADQLRKDFAESDKIVLSASWQVDNGFPVVFEGAPGLSPWLRLAGDVVKLEPHVWGIESFTGGEFAEVLHVEIRKKDLTSAKIGKDGAVVFSAVKFWIRARGNKGYEGMPEIHHDPMPDMVWLIYNM